MRRRRRRRTTTTRWWQEVEVKYFLWGTGVGKRLVGEKKEERRKAAAKYQKVEAT